MKYSSWLASVFIYLTFFFCVLIIIRQGRAPNFFSQRRPALYL